MTSYTPGEDGIPNTHREIFYDSRLRVGQGLATHSGVDGGLSDQDTLEDVFDNSLSVLVDNADVDSLVTPALRSEIFVSTSIDEGVANDLLSGSQEWANAITVFIGNEKNTDFSSHFESGSPEVAQAVLTYASDYSAFSDLISDDGEIERLGSDSQTDNIERDPLSVIGTNYDLNLNHSPWNDPKFYAYWDEDDVPEVEDHRIVLFRYTHGPILASRLGLSSPMNKTVTDVLTENGFGFDHRTAIFFNEDHRDNYSGRDPQGSVDWNVNDTDPNVDLFANSSAGDNGGHEDRRVYSYPIDVSNLTSHELSYDIEMESQRDTSSESGDAVSTCYVQSPDGWEVVTNGNETFGRDSYTVDISSADTTRVGIRAVGDDVPNGASAYANNASAYATWWDISINSI